MFKLKLVLSELVVSELPVTSEKLSHFSTDSDLRNFKLCGHSLYPTLSPLQCGLNLDKKSLKVTQDTESLSRDANEN